MKNSYATKTNKNMLGNSNYSKCFYKRGFSLLEAILSIAIIAILAGIAVPIYRSFLYRDDMEVMTNNIVRSLRRAQFLAQGSVEDSIWGVYLENNNVTIFKGDSYLTRDINFDEEFPLENSVSLSGLNEIKFDKFTGIPQNYGQIILNTANENKNITINEKGMVSY